MERLTHWNCKDKGSALPKQINDLGDTYSIEDVCAKLAVYEDAEESGHLIIVPNNDPLSLEQLDQMIGEPVWCGHQLGYKCGIVGKKEKTSKAWNSLIIIFDYGFEWVEDVIVCVQGRIYAQDPRKAEVRP